jgi:hypothetical protein
VLLTRWVLCLSCSYCILLRWSAWHVFLSGSLEAWLLFSTETLLVVVCWLLLSWCLVTDSAWSYFSLGTIWLDYVVRINSDSLDRTLLNALISMLMLQLLTLLSSWSSRIHALSEKLLLFGISADVGSRPFSSLTLVFLYTRLWLFVSIRSISS